MRRLDLTLPTPAENLALDEALLDAAECGQLDDEVLRIWESPQPAVVVGRSSRIAMEVDEAACRSRQVPVLRRSSGGAAIVAGPGCLMYALVLSYEKRPELKDIRRAHACVLGNLATALGPAMTGKGKIVQAGTSDLVFRSKRSGVDLKFSGNSLRAKKRYFLYHGTMLYDFDVDLISDCLRMPPRQPDYRDARPHRQFVTNLPLDRAGLVTALLSAWSADAVLAAWPAERTAQLAVERFSSESWNREFA